MSRSEATDVTDSRVSRATGSTLTREQLVALQGPLRRYVLSRVRDPHRADDIVQETLVRLIEVSGRLEIHTLTAYAMTVARNEIAAQSRSVATERRHLPRLVELAEPPRPDERVSAGESRQALEAALAALPHQHRALVVAHDLHHQPLSEIAERTDQPASVLASQLHRSRARLRVDYVLALRRITLPSARCRPVLLAISSGDRRSQRALGAGDHLAECPTCAELAPPLLHRDRALAGAIPWVALGSVHGHVEVWVRAHPKTSVGSSAVGVAAAVAAVVSLANASPAQTASPTAAPVPVTAATVSEVGATPTSSAPGTPATPSTNRATPGSATPGPAGPVPRMLAGGKPVYATRAELGARTSVPVDADRVVVLAVPGDEGFWVGSPEARIWVQLTGRGESPVHVTAGMRLTFTGVVVPNAASFVADLGLSQAADRDALTTQGVHVEVPSTGVTPAQ